MTSRNVANDDLTAALIEGAVLMERILEDERRDWMSRPVATALQTIRGGLEQYAALVDDPEITENLLRLEGVVGRVVLDVQRAVMEDYGRRRQEDDRSTVLRTTGVAPG